MGRNEKGGLCLTRKLYESVYIFVGETKIEVQLIGTMGPKARLRFIAPDNVDIHRAETMEHYRPDEGEQHG